MDRGYSRLCRILADALERPVEHREAFLKDACGKDAHLLKAVEALLRASTEAEAWQAEASRRRTREDPQVADATTETLRKEPTEAGTGPRIGPYHIQELIGEGGMGEVFRAEQRKPIRRTVAVKVIKRGMDTKAVIRRFEAERQALALLDHPNIAKVFDAGTTNDGRPYFVMEYVRGIPLTTYCDRNKLNTRERLELFVKLCDGVQHAHQKAIIHRDLKPSNVLVTVVDNAPVPVIIDFGVAKATGQKLTETTLYTAIGELVGTPEYMSPEQAEVRGDNIDIDTRTDVYALGVILYQLLTGALPFEPEELRRAGVAGIVRLLLEKDPPKPSTKLSTMGDRASDVAAARRTVPGKLSSLLRGDLDWIVMKALEKDRTRRFASVSELAADVQRHLRHEPVMASPPSVAYRARKFVRRHRMGVAVALGSGMVLVAFAVTMAVQAQRLAAERDRVRREAELRKEVSDFLEGLFADIDPFRTGGRSVDLRAVLDRSAGRLQQELRSQPGIQASLMLTLGEVYSDIGLVEEAAPLLAKSLYLLRQRYGRDHLEVGRALRVQAGLEAERRHIAQADSILMEALRILERELGATHAEVALGLRQMAVIRRHQERFAEAESLYARSMELLRAQHGPIHDSVGKVMSDLGVLHYFQGDTEAAADWTRRAMQVYESQDPMNHALYGESMNNLGAILLKQGRVREAAGVFESALAIQRQYMGSRHPHVARTLSWLGRTYRDLGRYEDAVTMQDEAYRIYASTLGEDHPRVERLLNGLQRSVDAYADSLVGAGHIEKADSLVKFYRATTPLGQR